MVTQLWMWAQISRPLSVPTFCLEGAANQSHAGFKGEEQAACFTQKMNWGASLKQGT